MSLFAGLSFGAPWVLAGLIALPAIWWLLRVTPPAPKRVVFPPFRLLQGLASREETPARTPWWLLLLRIVCAAFVIVALSDPIWGRVAAIGGGGPLVLFVDNDWAAAGAWRDRESQLSQILTSAARAGRAVAIVASADPMQSVSLLDAGQAERTAESLPLRAWLPDRVKAAKALARAHFSARPEVVWLSDGLDNADAAATAKVLSQTGSLTVFADAHPPVVLTDTRNEADGFVVQAARGISSSIRWAMAARNWQPRICISQPVRRRHRRASSCRWKCATRRGVWRWPAWTPQAPCICWDRTRAACRWDWSPPAISNSASRCCRGSFI
jgi:hypothetical protein